MRLFKQLQAVGGEPEAVTFTAALSACEKGWRWKHALELFHKLHSRCVQASLANFNSAISSCEKGQRWELAL